MILFLIGLASGIVSGMGMGGGTILIPALIFLAGVPQHLAQSVNLSVFFPASICALWIHTKNKHVRYKLALKIIVVVWLDPLLGQLLQYPCLPKSFVNCLECLFWLWECTSCSEKPMIKIRNRTY